MATRRGQIRGKPRQIGHGDEVPLSSASQELNPMRQDTPSLWEMQQRRNPGTGPGRSSQRKKKQQTGPEHTEPRTTAQTVLTRERPIEEEEKEEDEGRTSATEHGRRRALSVYDVFPNSDANGKPDTMRCPMQDAREREAERGRNRDRDRDGEYW